MIVLFASVLPRFFSSGDRKKLFRFKWCKLCTIRFVPATGEKHINCTIFHEVSPGHQCYPINNNGMWSLLWKCIIMCNKFMCTVLQVAIYNGCCDNSQGSSHPDSQLEEQCQVWDTIERCNTCRINLFLTNKSCISRGMHYSCFAKLWDMKIYFILTARS